MTRGRWLFPSEFVLEMARFNTSLFFVAALVMSVVATACTSSSLTSTNPTPTKCQVSVSPATLAIGAAGGTARMDLAAQQECDWAATSDVGWLTSVAPASGQGNAELSVQVAANPLASTRRGNVKAGNITVVVTQDAAPCTYSLGPQSRTIAAAGGSTTFDLTTLAGCAWTATSDSPWLQIAGNGSGSASGTITVSVAANAGTSRTGRLSAAGQSVTVQQAGLTPDNCTFAVAPTSATAPASGGAASFAVTTQTGCAWVATSNVNWITVSAPSQASTSSGTVSYNVAANGTATPRTGAVTIGTQTFTVNQAPASCSYSLSAPSQTVATAGGAGSPVTLTTVSGCAWTASSSASWITLTSAASGTGGSTVTFSVAPNIGPERAGTLTIGGQTHTVTQRALLAPQCSYSLNPMSQNAAAGTTTGMTVAVTTQNGCGWNAASNVNWITITSASSGSGSGSVTFSVLANTGPARPGTLTIANLTATVNQASGCTYSINPTSRSVSKNSGSGTIAVTTASGCPWTAISNGAWIAVTGGASGSGNGSINYSFQANSSGNQRHDTISVNNLSFTLNQND